MCRIYADDVDVCGYVPVFTKGRKDVLEGEECDVVTPS
jgi:hypothetical protein